MGGLTRTTTAKPNPFPGRKHWFVYPSIRTMSVSPDFCFRVYSYSTAPAGGLRPSQSSTEIRRFKPLPPVCDEPVWLQPPAGYTALSLPCDLQLPAHSPVLSCCSFHAEVGRGKVYDRLCKSCRIVQANAGAKSMADWGCVAFICGILESEIWMDVVRSSHVRRQEPKVNGGWPCHHDHDKCHHMDSVA